MNGMCFCKEEPCQKMIDPPKLEPSDWEEQYTAGEPQTPPMWMIIVMAVGAVVIFYGIMIGVAYLLT